MKINFYEDIEDRLLKFAVIVTKSEGKWVFCKHKDRDTLEIPGGHREKQESILQAAKRELMEETGAIDFYIRPICVYSVTGKNSVNESGNETFGMLYYADVQRFKPELDSEIEKIELMNELPTAWTYPQIQPLLLAEVQRRISREM